MLEVRYFLASWLVLAVSLSPLLVTILPTKDSPLVQSLKELFAGSLPFIKLLYICAVVLLVWNIFAMQEYTKVPDVRGDLYTAAQVTLRAAELGYDPRTSGEGISGEQEVGGQEPAAGTVVPKNTRVVLFLQGQPAAVPVQEIASSSRAEEPSRASESAAAPESSPGREYSEYTPPDVVNPDPYELGAYSEEPADDLYLYGEIDGYFDMDSIHYEWVEGPYGQMSVPITCGFVGRFWDSEDLILGYNWSYDAGVFDSNGHAVPGCFFLIADGVFAVEVPVDLEPGSYTFQLTLYFGNQSPAVILPVLNPMEWIWT